MKNWENKVLEWAKERGIFEKGTVEAQFLKSLEEMTELQMAVIKNSIPDIEDAIGDVMVTIAVGCELIRIKEGKEIDFISKYEYIKTHRKIENFDHLRLIEKIAHALYGWILYEKNYEDISSIIGILIDVCRFYNLDLKNCMDIAYKEIAHRKGKMINGVFVKNKISEI